MTAGNQLVPESFHYFFGSHHQREGYGRDRFAAEAAFDLAGPVTHGGEDALDQVGGSDVFPVFGLEVVECQHSVAILIKIFDCAFIFYAVDFNKVVTRDDGFLLRCLHPNVL